MKKLFKSICDNNIIHKPEELENLIENIDNNVDENVENIILSLSKYLVNNKEKDIEEPSNYVLTSDNFLKILLILLRSWCKIPIIMMGETGCGKTSLIKYLTKNILGVNLEIINFHSGINENFILNEMEKFRTKALDSKKDVWIFLDEINTCDSLGLISEILCDRSMLGKEFPDNMIFVAACNPYKLRTFGSEVGLPKKIQTNRLVYQVHPLPLRLIGTRKLAPYLVAKSCFNP